MGAVETPLDRAVEELVYRAAQPAERIRRDRVVSQALTAIVLERIRQEEIGDRKRDAGIAWLSCADPAMDGGDFARFTVLGEEVGEVGRAVLETTYALTANLRDAYLRDLRKELVQVAAVALAWIEAVDARDVGD